MKKFHGVVLVESPGELRELVPGRLREALDGQLPASYPIVMWPRAGRAAGVVTWDFTEIPRPVVESGGVNMWVLGFREGIRNK